MRPRISRLVERNLVWLLAILTSLEAAGAAVQGLLDQRGDHLFLWSVVAAAMIGAALLVEGIKAKAVA